MAYTTPAWPVANAYLYGHIDTSNPGYKTIVVGGTTRTVSSGYRRFDDYLVNLDMWIGTEGWNAETQDSGRVRLWGGSKTITYTDRLGWLLGCAVEAGSDEMAGAAVTEVLARSPSPAMIPLLGLQWDQVEVTREDVLRLDRLARGHGYLHGGARVWAVKCTMTRWAFDALKSGWVLRGEISAEGAIASAVSSVIPAGTLTGHALGLKSVRWVGPSRDVAVVVILVSGVLS